MVILDLLDRLRTVSDGANVTVAVHAPEEIELARRWCEHSGNTVVASTSDSVTVRRGRVPDPELSLPVERRPGSRLWIYTNLDCNLHCDYCCVSSSPSTPRRALGLDVTTRLAREAAGAGVLELLLTGGEPFLLNDIDEIATVCAESLPTTLLTNGMLFRARRLEVLRRMPRSVRMQISLDSATAPIHDEHRGRGSWERAVAGIRTALAEGFVVRVAATLGSSKTTQEDDLRAFLDDVGIAPEDQILRPVARQGVADGGVVLTAQSLVPEVTVTADGVYWHPVTAEDSSMLVRREIFPLATAIEQVHEMFRRHRLEGDLAASSFPCA